MDNSITFVSTSIITAMLLQAFKLFKTPLTERHKELLPIVSIFVAAAVNTLMALATGDLLPAGANILNYLAQGIAAGLAASGGYDIVHGLTKDNKKTE